MGKQGIYVRELVVLRERLHVHRKQVGGRSDELKAGERIEPLGFDLVVRPSQAAHGQTMEVVGQGLAEVDVLRPQGPRQIKTRLVVLNPHQLPAADSRRGHEVVQFVMPQGRGRLGLDGG